MQLYTNAFMKEFLKRLKNEPINWPEVGKLYLRLRRERAGFPFPAVYGKMLEIHIYLVLRDMIRRTQNIYLKPITEGQCTANYEFYRGDADLDFNLRVRSLADGKDVAEYDLLVLFDSRSKFPLLIDAKMYKTDDTLLEVAARLRDFIVLDKLKSFLAPIEEKYNPDIFGYIVVVPKDMPLDVTEEQKEFVRGGGHFARISMNYKDFIAAVEAQPLY